MLLIVYGSLYPWHFEARVLPASPLWILLHSWEGPLNRFLLGDVVINVALYVPLGTTAFSMFRRLRPAQLAWIAPVLLGAVLSGCVEMLQLFVPTRHCSTVDLIANVCGSALGLFAGWIFEELSVIRSSEVRRKTRVIGFVDRAALALLFCSAAWLLFPLFPVLGRTALRQKAGLFLHAPSSALAIATAATCWFAAGRLFVAAGFAPATKWLAFSLLLIPAQTVIVFRQPTLSDLIGAASGFVLFVLIGFRVPGRVLAILFLLLLVVRGLAPFRFEPHPAAFTWLPFGGFLAMDWREGMLVLLEKLFLYGLPIWLFRAAGIRLATAATVLALILAAIEAAQMWIPGRTSEITDPLLAIVVALVLKACQPQALPRGVKTVEVLP